jgi:hypothetical protein
VAVDLGVVDSVECRIVLDAMAKSVCEDSMVVAAKWRRSGTRICGRPASA